MKRIIFFVLLVLTLLNGCDEGIVLVKNGLIKGTLTYQDLLSGTDIITPAGIPVTVRYSEQSYTDYSFKTSNPGQYTFSPQVEGSYEFSLSYTDSALQYDAGLIRKEDVDIMRTNEVKRLTYEGAFSATISKGAIYHDLPVSLKAATTGINLLFTDKDGNPIRGARVCLFESNSDRQANAPFCGGSIAYLASNDGGHVVFVGLQAKTYFFNAAGNIGVVEINNFYSPDAQTSGQLTLNEIKPLTVMLK